MYKSVEVKDNIVHFEQPKHFVTLKNLELSVIRGSSDAETNIKENKY